MIEVLLLMAVKEIFDTTAHNKLSSDSLCLSLNKLPEKVREWTQHDLAKALKPFGIRPRGRRVGDKILRGYDRDQFVDAWDRYLDPNNN